MNVPFSAICLSETYLQSPDETNNALNCVPGFKAIRQS